MAPLIKLLRAIAADTDDLDIHQFDTATVLWAIESGLGPYLQYCSRRSKTPPGSGPCHSWLVATDITARTLTGNMRAALTELLEASADIAREIVLLKGICTSSLWYPEPHFRTMGDIDLLVPHNKLVLAKELLLDHGYHQQSEEPKEFFSDHHHEMPFFHSKRGIWIELHTALFHPIASVATDRVFTIENIYSQLIPIRLGAATTQQFTAELQLIYTCSHWAEVLNRTRGIIGLLDALLILREAGNQLDWDWILSNTSGSMAASHLYLAVTWLKGHGLTLFPGHILEQLRKVQPYLNYLNLKILHLLINAYQIKGRDFGHIATSSNVTLVWRTLLSRYHPLLNVLSVPWYLVFPPDSPNRFNFRHQTGRIASLFGLKK